VPPPTPHPRPASYKLNIWDVGGQKTLRPYWRNYYEKTDGLIWVVDSADLARLGDCRAELAGLLQEERLFGATLLILANKQDIPSALSLPQIEEVRRRGGRRGGGGGQVAWGQGSGCGACAAAAWAS
jgi:GTPase SAR1 family protein